jgi:hypothetical protein
LIFKIGQCKTLKKTLPIRLKFEPMRNHFMRGKNSEKAASHKLPSKTIKNLLYKMEKKNPHLMTNRNALETYLIY